MHKLDFIVFGLARSGTTAMEKLICANDRIYCASEFFNPREDHSRLDVPAAYGRFVKDLERKNRLRPNFARSHETLTRKDPARVRAWGNKYPIYAHFYDRIMDELDDARAIMVYRDPKACAVSYQRRSENPKDAWPAGRRALFAAAEMMHIMRVLATTAHDDILVVPHSHLVRNQESVLADVSDYLLPGVAFSPDAEVMSGVSSTWSSRRDLSPVQIPGIDAELLDALAASGLDAAFPSDRTVRFTEIRDRIVAVSDRLPEDYVSFVGTFVDRTGNADVQAYFQTWKEMVLS